MEIQKMLNICGMVAYDVKNDAETFDGKLFNGKVVAEYFGNHGAAIGALADVLREFITQQTKITTDETRN